MLIDLDAAPAPAPVRRPSGTRWWKLLAAAAVLLPVGAAAVPALPPPFPMIASTGGQATLDSVCTDRALYAAHRAAGPGAGAVIVARPLVAGGPDWQVRVPLDGGELRLTVAGPVLIADAEGTVTVLDVATGRVRWRPPDGSTVAPFGDRALVSYFDSDTGEARLRLVDLASGRTRWTRPGYAAAAALDPAGFRLIMLNDGGQVEMRSTADGRLATSRDLNGVIVPEEQLIIDGTRPYQPSVAVAGDHAYVLGPSAVAALSITDGSLTWLTSVPRPFPVSAVSCGHLLCVTGSGGTTALDTATGEVRWSGAEWASYTADDLATSAGGRVARLDPATGRVVTELGRGVATGGLMLRAVTGGTRVTDLRTGRLHGELAGVLPFGCTVAGPFLACPTTGSARSVWRVG